MKTLFATVLAATLVLPLAVSAATVSINYEMFSGSQVTASGDARAARDAFIGGPGEAGEDFEGFIACNNTNWLVCKSGTIATGVGTFKGITPAQTPATNRSTDSQVAPEDQIVVRTSLPDPFGRFNVTKDGANWLDSNDMTGISWTLTAKPGHVFRAIAFMLTDLDDVNSELFRITANGQTIARTGDPKLANAALTLVKMSFEGRVTNLTIDMINGKGDGFGFDGARIEYAPVPVPAAGLLLLGALGGLAALRRRKA